VDCEVQEAFYYSLIVLSLLFLSFEIRIIVYVQLSLNFIRHRTVKTYRRMEFYLHAFLM